MKTRDEWIMDLADCSARVCRAEKEVEQAREHLKAADARLGALLYTVGALQKAGGQLPKTDLDHALFWTSKRWTAAAEKVLAEEAFQEWCVKTLGSGLCSGMIYRWAHKLRDDPAAEFDAIVQAMRGRFGEPETLEHREPDPTRPWWVRRTVKDHYAVKTLRVGVRREESRGVVIVASMEGLDARGGAHTGDMIVGAVPEMVTSYEQRKCRIVSLRDPKGILAYRDGTASVTSVPIALAAVDLVAGYPESVHGPTPTPEQEGAGR